MKTHRFLLYQNRSDVYCTEQKPKLPDLRRVPSF